MPRNRPVHHGALGAYFVSLRNAKGWAQRHAAELAQRKGLAALSRQVLLRLERGQIKNPEPAVLRAASVLYGVPYEEIVQRFVALRFSVEVPSDLVRQGGATVSTSERGSDVPASDVETRRLESNYRDLLAATEEIADRLLGIIGEHRAGETVGAAQKTETGVRKRGRKAS
jgi:transcriptional regulator with XRE-family HTH domain